MNLTERLDLAANRRTEDRPSVRLRALRHGDREAEAAEATVDLRPVEAESALVVDMTAAEAESAPVVDITAAEAESAPVVDITGADEPSAGSASVAEPDEAQWSHGLSNRLGLAGRFERRRERVERRNSVRSAAVSSEAAAVPMCPRCGAQARIDIADPSRGQMHLSCDSCFKMWQISSGESATSNRS